MRVREIPGSHHHPRTVGGARVVRDMTRRELEMVELRALDATTEVVEVRKPCKRCRVIASPMHGAIPFPHNCLLLFITLGSRRDEQWFLEVPRCLGLT